MGRITVNRNQTFQEKSFELQDKKKKKLTYLLKTRRGTYIRFRNIGMKSINITLINLYLFQMSFRSEMFDFVEDIGSRLRSENEERRREDRVLETALEDNNFLSDESSSKILFLFLNQF